MHSQTHTSFDRGTARSALHLEHVHLLLPQTVIYVCTVAWRCLTAARGLLRGLTIGNDVAGTFSFPSLSLSISITDVYTLHSLIMAVPQSSLFISCLMGKYACEPAEMLLNSVSVWVRVGLRACLDVCICMKWIHAPPVSWSEICLIKWQKEGRRSSLSQPPAIVPDAQWFWQCSSRELHTIGDGLDESFKRALFYICIAFYCEIHL